MKYAFLVLGILFLAFGVYGVVKNVREYRKEKGANEFSKEQGYWFLGSAIAYAASGFFLQLSIHYFAAFELTAGAAAMSLIGAGLFVLFFGSLWSAFYLRFYLPDLTEKQMKAVKLCLYGSIPLAVFAFLLMGEGVGPALTYPLVCGFSINDTGWHWLTAANLGDPAINSGFSVRWYGVIIVFGALVCYWVSDHKFYQKYGKHGILETCLLFAFPGGILGARIWYVVGNWKREGFGDNIMEIFRIWDGGLTILGGAVGGILAGVTYVLIRRKWVDIRFGMDVVVPTILLGQAIGRWGNFFNNEVYGQTVALANGWSWLSSWIAGQMHFDGATRAFLPEGMINVPLFLIESLLNIAGYFIIAYLIPHIWKKTRGLGVLSGFYLLWYGIVRIIMEPLRNPQYQMGVNNMWSIWNSLVYIILGVILIAVFQILWVVQGGKTWARGSLEAAEEKAAKKESVGRRTSESAKKDVFSAPKTIIGEEPKPNDPPKEE